MVKLILLLTFISSIAWTENSYERNCISCHKDVTISLEEMFMGYILVYGGEKNFKAGLKHYLQYPSKHISVMSPLFVKTYGIKKKTKLKSIEIDEALDIYWETYKIFGRLY